MERLLKLAAIGVLFIVIIVTALYYHYFIYGSLVATESIVIEHAAFGPYAFDLQGTTMNSALGFAGHSWTREGDVVYLKLRFALSSRWHPHGAFNISEGAYLEGVREIYLMGADKADLKLIWTDR